MSTLIYTIDTDWASEAALEETLLFFQDRNISATVFVTHHSKTIEHAMNFFDVGLHPFFNPSSSQGNTIAEVVKFVMELPHNLKGFRCHRFAVCNASKQAMLEVGMQISSNVCTNLDVIPPFQERFGLLEVPIFLEDGGYLWQKHPLNNTNFIANKLSLPGPKVILIHPMHFVLNTPTFDYMANLKKSLSRTQWIQMDNKTLNRLRYKGRGIRDFIIDLCENNPKWSSLRNLHLDAVKQHSLP